MEVSRVNVVYFLSQNGRVEHPHLIRARHLGRTGVRLRDVKRWLAEMRGKDMPDTFAWSYKRKYRTGFVWQDVMDDDLLTPISDNEYVLKGSQQVNLHATAKRHHFLSLDNSPAPAIHEKDQAPGAADDQDDGRRKAVDLQEAPPKSSSVEILKQDDGDFIASSGASDEPTIWRKAVFRIDAFRGRGWKEKAAAGADKEGKGGGGGGGGARMLNSSRSHGNAGYAKRATEVLRSVLRCRDICTDYEALHPIRRRREKGRSSSAAADGGRVKQNGSYRTERSNRSGEGAKRTGDKGVHPTAFNPAYVPHCSQSGRTFKFKPEKLHLHT